MIYVDNAATTYPKPECVYEALDHANRGLAFNAGRGESEEAEAASNEIEQARENVASLVRGARPNGVVFTSSATDALNRIIFGMDLQDGDVVYVSPFEHNSIIRPLHVLQKKYGVRFSTRVLPFREDTWELDETKMAAMFVLEPPTAVLISHVSNVTGYELPVEKIFSAAKTFGAVNVLDASQSFGVLPIPAPSLCSYIVFAGHKTLYGSFGVGGFLVMEDKDLTPCFSGGTGSDTLNPDMPEEMPSRYEAGSPNVVAIAALNASIPWLKTREIAKHERELSEALRAKLMKLHNVTVFYPNEAVTNGILSFAVEGYSSSDIGILLKSKSISVRTGYHCAPLVHEFIGSLDYEGTVRVSFGAFNTMKDVEEVSLAISQITHGDIH